MRAIVVHPGEEGSVHLAEMPDPEMTADQVAVKMIRAGLCGTDREIGDGKYGEPPSGESRLILGHENLGIVEQVGKKVRTVKRGDLVVATVRRPCGVCFQCRHGESDMCTSGRYQERGILRRHGYMAEYYVESPEWLNRIPASVGDLGVLLEPMSVVEKGIEQAFALQRRTQWRPRTAVVLGAGPIGLLAAAALRLRGLATYVLAREPRTDVRARLAQRIGATFRSVRDTTLLDLRRTLPPIDLGIEATGAPSVAFAGMQMLGRGGVLCLLSVTPGDASADEPIARINQRLVLNNNVVFGSVSANPRHYKRGVRDLMALQKKWPGFLDGLITSRIPWVSYATWFSSRAEGIKTTLEITARPSALRRRLPAARRG